MVITNNSKPTITRKKLIDNIEIGNNELKVTAETTNHCQDLPLAHIQGKLNFHPYLLDYASTITTPSDDESV